MAPQPIASTPTSLLKQVVVTRWSWRILILLSSFCASIAGIASPWFQKEFIDRLLGVASPVHLDWFQSAGAWIVLSFFTLLIAQGLSQLTLFLGTREALHMQNIFARQIYQKMMLLRSDTMARQSIGEVVSLYATDVPGATVFLDQTLPMGASTLFPLILAPFALHFLFDIPVTLVVIAIVAVATLNTCLAFRQSKFFYRFKQLAGERIGLVNEWVQNIRALRILGWTEDYEKRIFAKRRAETANRVSMVTNGQVMNSVSTSVTFALNVATLAVLTWGSARVLSPGEILALMWILTVFLTRPFRQMPWFFTFGFDAWTSLRRLQIFLDTANPQTQQAGASRLKVTTQESALEIEGLRLQLGEKTLLDDISLRVSLGEFVAVVGEVGSGKSLLLLSLLRETGATSYRYLLHGQNANTMTDQQIRSNFSYVPQESFIMSATLRDNVAFRYSFPKDQDAEIHKSLLKVTFGPDLQRLQNGLNEEIGERGVNLSGGQKQRLSMARAHFNQNSILLLDDCLSAVDVETEDRLTSQLFRGEWQNKTKILVTHRLSILKHVDRILFLHEGRILAEGDLQHLQKTCPAFVEFAATLENTSTPKDPAHAPSV